MYKGLANYDREDYVNERDRFVCETQQEVWDLWVKRLIANGYALDDKLKLEIVTIVEDWSGHSFMLDIPIPPRPEHDIPF